MDGPKAGAEPVRRSSPARFSPRSTEPPGSSTLGPSNSMQQALSEGEGVPFRFEMEDSAGGSLSVSMPAVKSKRPQANWIHAGGHTVTAVVGVGVLALPYTFSYMTWTGGLITLSLSAAVSLYTSYLLAAMHQDEHGTRHNRYVDLGKHVLGDRLGFWVVAPVQFTVMVGLCVTYMVTAGQSLQAAHHPDCSGHVYTGPGEGATQAQCSSSLRWWILAFTLVQLGLSQLKDFHSIWYVSIVGATMSACYSLIACITSAVAVDGTADYSRRSGSSSQVAFEVMNSLGTTMFAFGGHVVLLEIQATLTTPPPPVVSMMRGLLFAYAIIVCAYFPVAIAGYAAFGNAVDADVLLSVAEPQWLIRIANVMVTVHVGASWQVFAQPIFEAMEGAFARRKPAWAGHIPKLRMVWRSVYVLLVAALAITVPFFQALMGLVGALGFTPITFILPPLFWQKVKGNSVPAWQRWLHGGIIVVFFFAGVLALVGSVRNIVVMAGEYHYGGT